MRARAQVIRTNAGRVHMIGIAMDVTEQHRLAQRYAEADQRLADAIECTSEAFVLWDKNDRLVMCNAHFQQAYGLPDRVLVPGTERAAVNAAAARPSSSGASPMPTASNIRARRKCSLPTSAGCRSTSGAPATAAWFPSAPTSPC
jgi:two-component system cell cycle sensor histidine kinase PleC